MPNAPGESPRSWPRSGVRLRRANCLSGSPSRAAPMWSILHRTLIDSTSDEARRILDGGDASLPFVIRADHQTQGRGRGTHTWWSDGGSLLFTVAFDPASFGLMLRHEAMVALTAAVCVI